MVVGITAHQSIRAQRTHDAISEHRKILQPEGNRWKRWNRWCKRNLNKGTIYRTALDPTCLTSFAFLHTNSHFSESKDVHYLIWPLICHFAKFQGTKKLHMVAFRAFIHHSGHFYIVFCFLLEVCIFQSALKQPPDHLICHFVPLNRIPAVFLDHSMRSPLNKMRWPNIQILVIQNSIRNPIHCCALQMDEIIK